MSIDEWVVWIALDPAAHDVRFVAGEPWRRKTENPSWMSPIYVYVDGHHYDFVMDVVVTDFAEDADRLRMQAEVVAESLTHRAQHDRDWLSSNFIHLSKRAKDMLDRKDPEGRERIPEGLTPALRAAIDEHRAKVFARLDKINAEKLAEREQQDKILSIVDKIKAMKTP